VDLQGFSLSQFWQMKSLIRSSFQISQDYFPETMGQLAIVNAPSSFTLIWSMVKPWLSKETAEKIDVFGSDYKDRLLKLIDADCLPSTLGGTCECKDEGGCQLSGAGPWLDGRVGWGPKSKSNEKRLLANPSYNQGSNAVGAKQDRGDFVALYDGIAPVQPIDNGKIRGVEVDNGADEQHPGTLMDSSSPRRSD